MRQSAYDFLLAIYCDYIVISYHFRVISSSTAHVTLWYVALPFNNRWLILQSIFANNHVIATLHIARWILTRKPSYRWLTRAMRKPAKNCFNSTCLQRCRWQYWPIFIRLAVVASEICEIPRNSLKIQAYKVQGHPRSSILVSIESPYVTCY